MMVVEQENDVSVLDVEFGEGLILIVGAGPNPQTGCNCACSCVKPALYAAQSNMAIADGAMRPPL